ncbi:MAG TPA: hypothetical protein VN408_05395 [Actinoplanes sp.]|nr:hypothetical protein [Actinoplanes sp.]
MTTSSSPGWAASAHSGAGPAGSWMTKSMSISQEVERIAAGV